MDKMFEDEETWNKFNELKVNEAKWNWVYKDINMYLSIYINIRS